MFIKMKISSIWIFFCLINSILANSSNQPIFCSNATWNPKGITFADETIVGTWPSTLFIDTNNTIYVASYIKKEILIWFNQSSNSTKIIRGDFLYPKSMFVTNLGDIFIDNGGVNNQVDKWISKNETFINMMNVDSICFGLFVDQNNSLYCSMGNEHKIVKKWLNDIEVTPTTVAGNGTEGSAPNQLFHPRGIFIDDNFDLYVADNWNNRIQKFEFGKSNGITKAGKGSFNVTIQLRYPCGIILDGNKYLFILDHQNSRIIGENENSFRCLVGCYAGLGSQSHQLYFPSTLSFDIDGNIFVSDTNNHRIQKFIFEKDSCQNQTSTTNQIKQSLEKF
ncbi:unnamed protein product [Adineta ricciae]|uniref:NHL repeat containing protein-like protein n=1 Tax=Adineta ricciae TaxID=249248 RepID=A0A816DNR9_ADIRI|nr:unnamed protein product [Adineta ricciae]